MPGGPGFAVGETSGVEVSEVLADDAKQRCNPERQDSNRPMPAVDQVVQPLDDQDQVSGTDIAGDETNVRTRKGVDRPGIADTIPPQPE